VNFEDEVPVLVFHLLEGDISENACVVDQNVNSFEVVEGCFDYFVSQLD